MDTITHNISDWWIAHYDPFYGYVGEGALLIAGVTAAAWYFPVLRSLAGAVVFGTVATLFGFRKGEQAIQKQDAAKEDMAKPQKWGW